MEIISIISCIAAVGSLIVAIISLLKSNDARKEIRKLKAKNIDIETKDNSGVIIGVNAGEVKNEK